MMDSANNDKITNTQTQDSIPLPDDRREALRLWMFANHITLQSLADLIGITHGALSQALGGERMPVRNHEVLIAAGIPAHLLPRAEDIRPGPRPKGLEQSGVCHDR